eukprot:2770832-Pyramimonas_sp.AAC.1
MRCNRRGAAQVVQSTRCNACGLPAGRSAVDREFHNLEEGACACGREGDEREAVASSPSRSHAGPLRGAQAPIVLLSRR